MRVLKLILGKIYFSTNFPSVFIFQCEASGRYSLASRRVKLRRPDGQVTRPDAGDLVACLCGNVRPDGLVISPDGEPKGLKIAFSPSRRTFFWFHLEFCLFWCDFFCILSFYAFFSPFQVLF
jgi:hypothetical protein